MNGQSGACLCHQLNSFTRPDTQTRKPSWPSGFDCRSELHIRGRGKVDRLRNPAGFKRWHVILIVACAVAWHSTSTAHAARRGRYRAPDRQPRSHAQRVGVRYHRCRIRARDVGSGAVLLAVGRQPQQRHHSDRRLALFSLRYRLSSCKISPAPRRALHWGSAANPCPDCRPGIA